MKNLDYTKLKSYQPYSPIFVRGYYIRKEVVSAGKLAQKKIAIVFQNIGDHGIRAFSGQINSKDVFGNSLSPINFEMIELEDFFKGEFVGEKTFLDVHQKLDSIEITIEKVVFIGGESMTLSKQNLTEIPESKQINLDEDKYHRYIYNKYTEGFSFKHPFIELEGAYLCSCGNINFVDNFRCCQCNVEKRKINTPLDIETIEGEINEISNEFAKSFDAEFINNLTADKLRDHLKKNKISFRDFYEHVKSKHSRFTLLDEMVKNQINSLYEQDLELIFDNFYVFADKYKKLARRSKIFNLSVVAVLAIFLLYFSIDIISTFSYKENQIDNFINDLEIKIVYDEIDDYYDSRRYEKYSFFNRDRYDLITFSEERDALEASFRELLISTNVDDENYDTRVNRYSDNLQEYEQLIRENQDLINECNEDCDIKIPFYEKIIDNYQFIIDNQDNYIKTLNALLQLRYFGEYIHSDTDYFFQLSEDGSASWRMNHVEPSFDKYNYYTMLMNGDFVTVEDTDYYRVDAAVRQFNINSDFGSSTITFYNYTNKEAYELESADFSFEHTSDGDGFVITDYRGESSVITLPSIISGIPISEIDAHAFGYHRGFSKTQITNINLPESIQKIGYRAFSSNKLTEIVIPASVLSIENEAFWNNPLNNVIINGDKKRFEINWTSIGFPEELISETE